MLRYGADIYSLNNNGLNAFYLAIQNGHLSLGKKLLKSYPELVHCYSMANDVGDTLLHLTAKYDDMELTINFMNGGGNIDKQNKQGDTPLHLAVKNNAIELTNFLLRNDANVNVENKEGKRPVDLSTSYEMEQLFLETYVISSKH